jgi:hypothetical protein
MPSPIIPSHRVQFSVVGGTREHKVRWYTDAVPSADPSGFDFLIFGGGTVGGQTAVTAMFTLLRALWPASMNIAQGLLAHHVLGAYTPVGVFSNANVGTHAGSIAVAQQTTVTYRTSVGRQLLRQVYLETPEPYVGRIVIAASLPAGLQAWVADMLDKTPGHMGSWVKSRGDNFSQSYLSVVYDTNDRVRRDAGIA